MNVVQLPSRNNVERLWQDYVDRLHAIEARPGLRSDLTHNIEMARAWQRWRDAFLAMDGL